MTTSHSTSRQMKASCPEDLLAFVPIAIGFVPSRSVVLLTVQGARPFHARVDLPDDDADIDDLVEALLRPARKHGIGRVVLVVYDDDTAIADETAWSLVEAFREAEIEVFEVLRVHDDHYFAVLPGRHPQAYRGIAFEVRDHRFAVESVFDGRVTHDSREALAATLTRDPDGADVVGALVAGVRPLPLAGIRPVITSHTGSGSPTPPGVVAALAVSMTQPDLRDEAWHWLHRSIAREYVEFWSDVVRRSPEALVPGTASVLAFTAWLAGDGALAWCAVDRARAVDPEHSLASLVADMLDSATSPELWEEVAQSLGESPEGVA